MTGEISPYPHELCFAYAGDIDTPTGGYGYDRRIIAGLRQLGWQVTLLPLGEGFPFPDAATLAQAIATLEALPHAMPVIVDGLAYACLGAEAARLGKHLRLIALVHHPLCLEHGLTADEAAQLQRSEAAALAAADGIIVTSPATARLVSELFALPLEGLGIAEPGTDPVPSSRGSGGPGVALISVGSVLPRKGHDLLVGALSRLQDLDWTLRIIGGLRDSQCVTTLQADIDAAGLCGRIVLTGAMEAGELARAFESADVFVLASRYEGYGMAFAEALAYGLPVIGSGGEAVRRTFERGGAIYVEPDDLDGLTCALRDLIGDAERREALRLDAVRASTTLPQWFDASRIVESYVLERILG